MSTIVMPFFLGPLWTPTNLARLPQLWLNDTSTITSSGGFVSQWNDISGNGYHITQSTGGLQPAVNASGLNSMRTIQWDGSDDYMEQTSAGCRALFQNMGVGWRFRVARKTTVDSPAANRTEFMAPTNSITASRFSFGTGVVANTQQLDVRRLDADSVSTLPDTGATDTSFHMLLIMMDWTNGDGFYYQDGALKNSNANLTTNGSTSNTASATRWTWGCNANVAAGFADMELAEDMIGNTSKPTGTEIDKLFGWAAWKWSLVSLLPAAHPYKNDRPRQ